MNKDASLYGGNGKLKSWNDPDGRCGNCGKRKCWHTFEEKIRCEEALVN